MGEQLSGRVGKVRRAGSRIQSWSRLEQLAFEVRLKAMDESW